LGLPIRVYKWDVIYRVYYTTGLTKGLNVGNSHGYLNTSTGDKIARATALTLSVALQRQHLRRLTVRFVYYAYIDIICRFECTHAL